jgi:preprotein translocase subunit SecB
MLSPIQLEEHKILRIHFDTRIIEGDSASLLFRHAITVAKQDEQGIRWLVRLDLQFMPETDDGTAPYIGEIAVVGVFSLPAAFPKEKASDMVHMNGGAILFGTARELLSSITARGIHGAIMLPTADARCFLPEPSANAGK